MIAQIEPQLRWDCPAGVHTATLESLHQKIELKDDRVLHQVRLLFRLDALSDEYQTAMAGKTYPLDLNPGSELRQLLDGWQGPDFVAQHLEGNRLDLSSLVDQRADLVLKHKKSRKYPKPFVNIVSAHPPGTKVRRKRRTEVAHAG